MFLNFLVISLKLIESFDLKLIESETRRKLLCYRPQFDIFRSSFLLQALTDSRSSPDSWRAQTSNSIQLLETLFDLKTSSLRVRSDWLIDLTHSIEYEIHMNQTEPNIVPLLRVVRSRSKSLRNVPSRPQCGLQSHSNGKPLSPADWPISKGTTNRQWRSQKRWIAASIRRVIGDCSFSFLFQFVCFLRCARTALTRCTRQTAVQGDLSAAWTGSRTMELP